MDLFHVNLHLHLLSTLPLIHSMRLGKVSKTPRPPLIPTTEAARSGRQAWVRSVYLETGPPFDVRGLGGSAAAATPCGGQPLAGDTPRQVTVRWSAFVRRHPTQTQSSVPAAGTHFWARQSGNHILCKFQSMAFMPLELFGLWGFWKRTEPNRWNQSHPQSGIGVRKLL